MAEERRRFGVGYALAPKKQKSFIRDSLVSLARSRGVDLIRIDAGAPLAEQGPFDVVLHKRYGEDWLRQLDDFSARNPNSLVVDPPEAIERLRNRISMLQAVTELAAADRSESFGIPKQTVIYDAEALLKGPASEGLHFPVIAKPLAADGSEKSHKMTLVYDRERLCELKPPIVLQEFVNHGGVIFKVYVAGKYVRCAKRKSLPDVSEEAAGATEGGLLSFSQVSNLATNERTDDKYYKKMRLDETEMPPLELLADIARGLRKAMGLNLFNFDVIRDSRFGDRYLIIDINYFPGYAKMPGYESVMTDFFCDLMENKFGRAIESAAAEKDSKKVVGGNSCCGDGDEGALPVSPRSREEENNPIQV